MKRSVRRDWRTCPMWSVVAEKRPSSTPRRDKRRYMDIAYRYPAHGAGSVCGAGMADRKFTTLGYERRHNPVLRNTNEGLHAWQISGRTYDQIPAVHASELVRRIQSEESFTLLDIRKIDEYEERRLPGAVHIFLGELPERLNEIPKDRPVATFCGSSQRAIIVASILKQHGFTMVEDSLGSMAACQAIGCPIVAR